MIDLFKVFFRDFVAVVEFRVLIYVFFDSFLSHYLFIFLHGLSTRSTVV